MSELAQEKSETDTPAHPHVGLFVTCLIDVMRPRVAFAAVKLLQAHGCRVSVPLTQTCCGQPAFNSGDVKTARSLTDTILATFEQFDFVVVPSGSCAAMLKIHLPALYSETEERQLAQHFADHVFELTEFLATISGRTAPKPSFKGRVAYHDGCSGKRELGLGASARQLLSNVEGLDLVELQDTETCCGFGGTFSVTYPEISNAMVTKKCADISKTAPDTLVGSELGCLLNIAGKLKRIGSPIACRHIAEVLAGDNATPAIGASDQEHQATSFTSHSSGQP